MASQSGRQTNIPKRRLGCRLPYENSKSGDGYANSSPMREYKLSPEEIIQKYGPVNETARSITAKSLEYAMDKSETPIEAAKFLRISLQYFWLKIEEFETEIPVEWESERPMSQLEIAREKLTKEGYLELKSQGLKDAEIMKQLDISNVNFYKIKKEFGPLESNNTGQPEPDNVVQFEPEIITQPTTPEVIWVTKDICCRIPAVKIGKHFRFNAAAKRCITAEHIKVGVVNNCLVIAPCEESEHGCYRLNHGKHSAAIGGDRLLRVVKQLGVAPGKYQLTKDEQNGWWIGKIMA